MPPYKDINNLDFTSQIDLSRISLRNRNLVFMLRLGWTNSTSLYGKHMENDEANGRMCPQRMEKCFN